MEAKLLFIFSLFTLGSDFQTTEVQHGVSYQDCSGASQPIRAAKNVGRTEEGQQELPLPHHKGMPLQRLTGVTWQ